MKQHRLVIIDDEQIVIEGIRAIIKREELPCDVVGSAGDGIEGRNVIREKEPDLVITDIRIPGIDGLSLIEEMREFLPDTCFIVISGYTEFQYAQKALKLGVLDYIDKPVTIAKLKEAIRRVDEAKLQNADFWRVPAGKAADTSAGTSAEKGASAGAAGAPAEGAGTGTAAANELTPETGHRVIDRLLQYIAKNYTNDLGLSELAEMVGLNPAYLSVLFKETVGESYIKYLTDLRIRKAKELLSGGGKIADVSNRVGYSNTHYFTDIFKKHEGMTPGEYRDGAAAREQS